jgi:cytochrome P450
VAAAVRASTYAQDPALHVGRRPSLAWREAEAELGEAIRAVFADPGRSGLTAAIAACPRGMAARDAQYLLRLLVLAGQETTVAGIAAALHQVLATPGALEALRATPAHVPLAVEEALRWLSPIVAFGRLATRDVELGGAAVRAGQRVACYFPSANRDEAGFSNPDQFLVDRRPNPHLAFGSGDHACPGAALARLQIRLAIEALLAAPGRWQAGAWMWWRGTTKRGPRSAFARVCGV